MCAANELLIGLFTKADGLYPRAKMLLRPAANAASLADTAYPELRTEKSSLVGLCGRNAACRGANCRFWNCKMRWSCMNQAVRLAFAVCMGHTLDQNLVGGQPVSYPLAKVALLQSNADQSKLCPSKVPSTTT